MISLRYVYRHFVGAHIQFFKFLISKKPNYPNIISKYIGQYWLIESFLFAAKGFKKIFGGSVNEFYSRRTIHPMVKNIDNTPHKKLGADPAYKNDKYKN